MTEVVEQGSASDSETSCLDLSYYLEFKDDNNSNYDDSLDGGRQPYLYETMEDIISNGSNDNDRSVEKNLERLSNLSWYVSLHFILLYKNMIAVHIPRLDGVCLNVWVFTFCQHYVLSSNV